MNNGAENDFVKDEIHLVSCMCVTYGRVAQLEEALQCFLIQDYPRRQLVIFNTFSEQVLQFDHPMVKIVNCSDRPKTLGECRNLCVEQCDGELIQTWDDDDIYLPGFISLAVKKLSQKTHAAFKDNFYAEGWQIKKRSHRFGAFSIFKKSAWREVGGYPLINSGEDSEFLSKLAQGESSNQFSVALSEIQSVYCWANDVYHISGRGTDKDGEITAAERCKNYVASQVVEKRIPVGNIILKPNWKLDWISQAESFRKNPSPSLVFPQDIEPPFISCQCITYGRVEHLEESIQCFLNQDYKGKKELVIFNDFADQFLKFDHPEVRIINSKEKFPSMGECRNECIKHCSGEVIVLWDDDDIQLPGYLTLLANTINGYGVASHKNVFNSSNFKITGTSAGFGNWIAYRRAAFDRIGGYAKMNAGDDQNIRSRLAVVTTENLKYCALEEIQFIYGWGNGVYHISGQGYDAPGKPSAIERMINFIDGKLRRGEIPVGEIHLQPKWRHDWSAMAAAYVAEHSREDDSIRFPAPVTGIATPKLSILITVLNDADEAHKTIHSIRMTAGDEPEIIVVDDYSTQPLKLLVDIAGQTAGRTKLVRNPVRHGCGASRQVAAIHATGTHLLIIDSHMRFELGWYKEVVQRLEARPETVYCGTCIGLAEGAMEMLLAPETRRAADLENGRRCSFANQMLEKVGNEDGKVLFRDLKTNLQLRFESDTKLYLPAAAEYTGARLNLYGPDANQPNKTQVFEGVWRDHKTDDQEIPCLMGASYFIKRDLFFYLGGLKQLKMWGSDEPYLSVKAWLAGYDVRILRTVRIGHKFRTNLSSTGKQYSVPYTTEPWYGPYNKIRCMLTLFNETESKFLISKLKGLVPAADFKRAVMEVRKDMVEVMSQAHYYRSIFKHDLKWYCDKFAMPYPIQ